LRINPRLCIVARMSDKGEFTIRIKNTSTRIKQISIKNTSTMSTYTFVPSMNKHNERFPAEFSYFVEYKRGSLCISSSSDLRILLNEEEYMNFFHPDIKCDISITDMDGNQYDYLGCYISSPTVILSQFGQNMLELSYSVDDFVYNGCSFKNVAYDSSISRDEFMKRMNRTLTRTSHPIGYGRTLGNYAGEVLKIVLPREKWMEFVKTQPDGKEKI